MSAKAITNKGSKGDSAVNQKTRILLRLSDQTLCVNEQAVSNRSIQINKLNNRRITCVSIYLECIMRHRVSLIYLLGVCDAKEHKCQIKNLPLAL